MVNSSSSKRPIRIGCASAFWGDTETAAKQLVQQAEIDYLVFDYLAEVTMSIMAGAKMKNPNAGFATDFVTHVMAPLLPDIASKNIKVISNGGGINPIACGKAVQQLIDAANLDLTVAVVLGDDLLPQKQSIQTMQIPEMFNGNSMPNMLISMNAYLGAPAIVTALEAGADIIITGRVVDSAVVLAPLIHEFGWSLSDYDKLAQGSLAGHIIECGAQCTGGNFTDWETVPDFHNMGFPIIECFSDGSFVTTKPDNTGGLVTTATVGEQLVYEIGDPRAYYLPDVICDFTDVTLVQKGPNQVLVSGAKGHPPTNQYKVSATYPDGFRVTTSVTITGINATKKAEMIGNALLKKVSSLYKEYNFAPFSETSIEILGTETTYGEHACVQNPREVILKIAVTHANKKALVLFSKEIAQASTGMAPGITGLLGGRPKVSPIIKLFSFTYPKEKVNVSVLFNSNADASSNTTASNVTINSENNVDLSSIEPQPENLSETLAPSIKSVPLIQLAYARSGDKGNHSNIGVIARQPQYLAFISAALTESAVAQYMQHVLDDDNSQVTRWMLPGIHGMNFLLENALGGGGIASLRSDPQGKAFAQQLLEFPIPISQSIADQLT